LNKSARSFAIDPAPPPPCDYLVCEATYGDRDHPPGANLDALAAVVQRSVQRGGVMLIAAFAIGRAQQLIYLLQILKRDDRIRRAADHFLSLPSTLR
jgi:metallo-beta-lactamase family protein